MPRSRRWGRYVRNVGVTGSNPVTSTGTHTAPTPVAARRFVLAPLAEAWPERVVPGHATVQDLVQNVTDGEEVRTDSDW